MAAQYENLSSDLIWQISRKNNSYLCKRKQSGGVQFSRDPLNLTNKHSRKYAGFANAQAIGINADSPNTIGLTTKLPARANKPAKSQQTASFAASTPSRKLYKSVVNTTAKRGYRADLRAAAVARASAVKLAQQQKKERAAPKPRGAAARKAAESS
ncbi:hypothetical protein WHR41_06368 [Cladosporium halotolerans]|uniref:Ribosomal eL28/Mak16 domain-containing protein n=1 Tax=Cladosporium halotolerans TaxID=1052096 RepID=A0AB34KI40_9PEZI